MLQLWFVSRALGSIGLLLLSAVIVLGVLHNTSVVKNADLGLPRFVLVALHRNLSLLAVVFVVLHVVTAVITGWVGLRWIDLVVPGIAAFNPIGAALGTIAFDLLLVIVVTSVLRQRIPRRLWFWVHWTAYLCWPVATVHAVLNVSFAGTTWWTLVVPLVCSLAILAALAYRWRDQRRVAVPLAERGKVPDEALRAVTGELPLAAPRRTASPAPAPPAPASPAPAGPPDDDAPTELIPATPPRGAARRVVPLSPRRGPDR